MARSSYNPQIPGEKLLMKALCLYVSHNPGYLDSERTAATLRQLIINHCDPQKMTALFSAASRTPKLFNACNLYDAFREKTSDLLMVNILTGMVIALTDPSLTLGELMCIAESED